MARSTLLIATTNAHKITEFRRLLGDLEFDLLVPSDIDLHLEVDETGDSFEANARLKAHAFCLASGIPSLADDSGIEVDALDGRPGVFSARYGGSNLDDEGRVRLLLSELADVPTADRSCRYRVVIVVAYPDGSDKVAEGTCEGSVDLRAHGANGFGYDPIFRIPSYDRTIAELDPEQKDLISHRGEAARRMAALLVETSTGSHP